MLSTSGLSRLANQMKQKQPQGFYANAAAKGDVKEESKLQLETKTRMQVDESDMQTDPTTRQKKERNDVRWTDSDSDAILGSRTAFVDVGGVVVDPDLVVLDEFVHNNNDDKGDDNKGDDNKSIYCHSSDREREREKKRKRAEGERRQRQSHRH